MVGHDSAALHLASIVQSSEDAIVSKDLHGIVQSWNPAAERMFGYSAEEMIGQSIRLVIPADRQGEEDRVLEHIRAGDAVKHYETVRRRKDGSLIEISLTVSPIRDARGQIIGASKIARDISERNELMRQVERASRMKDEFLATLSHELRTPLNAILGYARILKQFALEDRPARAALAIERNGKALNQLVSDILDMSAVSAGKIRLDVGRCSIAEIIDDAVAVIAPAADAKRLTIERRTTADDTEMWGDARRMQQVFWNLLSNAVKFTPPGGTVRIAIDTRPDHLVVTVSDTGIGIDPSFLPHLFQRFTQADSRTTREFGGIGLGLALVRHFVTLHGGTVHARSDGPGRGATFEVRLPRLALVAAGSRADQRSPLPG
jgi:PAS domain S-box-containing protein